MDKFRKYLQKYPKTHKAIFLINFTLLGCLAFPFGNSRFPFDFWKAYLLIVGYGIIGSGFAGIYGANKRIFVYTISLILTVLGMFFRYILEYGELSNTRNFTQFNIISFLAIIPAFTVITYHFCISRMLDKN